jgi:hypothetical protein
MAGNTIRKLESEDKQDDKKVIQDELQDKLGYNSSPRHPLQGKKSAQTASVASYGSDAKAPSLGALHQGGINS